MPLTMPMTPVTSAAASDSRSTLITGTAPTDAGLEAQVDAGVLGRLQQLGAVLREKLLVGRDDRLAGLERLELEAARRLEAADQLHDDVDLRIADDLGEVGRDGHALRDQLRPLGGPLEDATQLDVLARGESDLVGLLDEQAARRPEPTVP